MNWVVKDETPWCSIFLNWVALKSGFERSGKANARSWLDVGIPINNPEPGDIVVYWREDPNSELGHVGLFMGYSRDQAHIYTLGGNQGNSVSISSYPVNRLLQFRRLRRYKVRLTNSILKYGDKGPEVAILQDSLKMAGFNCGTSDGHFGPRTLNAVKELQRSSNGEIEPTGVFDSKTKKFLKKLIGSI